MIRDIQDIQLATFLLGETLFALDIMRIIEIIPTRLLSNLASPSRYLDGVITVRGEVVPVMNMHKRFGLSHSESSPTGKLILVRLSRQSLALAVDDVLDVITIPVNDLKPAPAADGVGSDCILGTCLAANSVVMIVDIDALLCYQDCLDIAGIEESA